MHKILLIARAVIDTMSRCFNVGLTTVLFWPSEKATLD